MRKFLLLFLFLASPAFADQPRLCRSTIVTSTGADVTTQIFEFFDHPALFDVTMKVITAGSGTVSAQINGYGPQMGDPTERAIYILCTNPLTVLVSRCTDPGFAAVEAASATVTGCTNCKVRINFCGSQP